MLPHSWPTDGQPSPTSDPLSQSREIASLADAVHSRLSSLVASLASPTAPPASDSPAPTSAISGTSAPECLGIYDPASRCSRTSQACLPLSQGLFSTEYLVTWPRFGMLASGKLYRLPTLERPTAESACGSSALTNWPTATASDTHTDRLASSQQTDGSMHSVTLPQDGLREWPTPTAAEGTKIGSQANYGQLGLSNHPAIQGRPTRPKGEKSRSGPPPTDSGPLGQDSHSTNGSRPESWATPTGDDANNATRQSGAYQSLTRQAGKLNPDWVETLMGLPIGWTQLPHKFVKPRTAPTDSGRLGTASSPPPPSPSPSPSDAS
jgi:hypothetical protein